MEKLIYLLWAPERSNRDEFRDQLLHDCAPRLLESGAHRLSLAVRDSDSDVPSPVPAPAGEPVVAGTFSIWLACHDRRGSLEDVMASAARRLAGYLVTESLYTDYGGNRFSEPRKWPDGERSPGVLTVTFLEKPKRLSYSAWIQHWYGTQSPLSEKIQPRMRYVRNAVARPLTDAAPPYLGIVEEAWSSKEVILDPMLFYCGEGSHEKMRTNMKAMLESVQAFLDLDRIRTTAMSEYVIKSE